jgi:N-acetylmuramoyl-L-alanine amidase
MTISKIVVHQSDSPHGRGDNAETIHQWHIQRGWDGIGYHEVITEAGQLEHGRPHYWQGAHTKGHNADSIGICVIGRNTFTSEQKMVLRMRIAKLMQMYPEAKVYGHCELDPNKPHCPGDELMEIVRLWK